MCPEFLREGSGVADFFNPPFVVLGTADQRVTDLLTEMFSFLNREIRLVDVRSAEALKYACNAFHATKVSFANEMARIFRMFGVDSREVMRVFSEDKVLNISPAYLMPGFAFGGSCLPKDLRALLDMARVNALDVPLLAGTAAEQRAGHRRRRGPADRQPVPYGRHAGTELQDEHRRPAGEPERRAGGAADRQGLRRPDLRPDRQPGAPYGLQPALHREPPSAPASTARRDAP